ncbi:hypothetical protein ACWD64_37940 [Streptomyces antibioticus]
MQNLRDRIRKARANGWLGEVEGLQVSFDAAMAKLKSLKNIPTAGDVLNWATSECLSSPTTLHRLKQMKENPGHKADHPASLASPRRGCSHPGARRRVS